MSKPVIKKEISLNCTKQLAISAVYDVADAQKVDTLHDNVTDDVRATMTAFDNISGFLFSFDEDGVIVKLTVAIEAPAQGLSGDGQKRAVNYLADCIIQHLENDLKINALVRTNKNSQEES